MLLTPFATTLGKIIIPINVEWTNSTALAAPPLKRGLTVIDEETC